jgi:hypothetical protein
MWIIKKICVLIYIMVNTKNKTKLKVAISLLNWFFFKLNLT